MMKFFHILCITSSLFIFARTSPADDMYYRDMFQQIRVNEEEPSESPSDDQYYRDMFQQIHVNEEEPADNGYGNFESQQNPLLLEDQEVSKQDNDGISYKIACFLQFNDQFQVTCHKRSHHNQQRKKRSHHYQQKMLRN